MTLDGRGKNQEHGSQERRTNRIRLQRASGWLAAPRDPICRNRPSRSAAPQSFGWFARVDPVQASAVGEGQVLNRARRSFDSGDAQVAAGAPPHGSAPPVHPTGGSGTGDAVGLFKRRCPSSFARRWSFESWGSSHPAAQGRGFGIAAVGVVAAPQVGASTRRGSFERPLCGLMSRAGSRGPSAANGWRAPRVGCRASSPTPSLRAAQQVIRASSHSRASELARPHSTGPSNTQMEPTRPTVCAIMRPRRAAHLQRSADRYNHFQP